MTASGGFLVSAGKLCGAQLPLTVAGDTNLFAI